MFNCNWLTQFLNLSLTVKEQEIINALEKWPKGSVIVTECGSISVDPSVVNALPETIKAREQARKIVEGSK